MIKRLYFRLRYRLRNLHLKISEKVTIISAILSLILSVITIFILAYNLELSNQNTHLSEKALELSNENRNLTLNALCIQKDFNYKDIAPPTITVVLERPPYIFNNYTTLIFQFHIIPNSKTFLFPYGLNNRINGFSDNITDKNGLSLDHPDTKYEGLFGYDYRNETQFNIIYNLTNNSNSLYVNFIFKIKDAIGNEYKGITSYNVSIQDNQTQNYFQNIESIRDYKVFEFKRPDKYKCY